MTSQERYEKRRAYHAAYYARNRAKRKAQAAAVYRATKEKQLARAKAWQAANKDIVRRCQKEYRERNKETIRAKNREYKRRHAKPKAPRATRKPKGNPQEVAARLLSLAERLAQKGYSGRLVMQ